MTGIIFTTMDRADGSDGNSWPAPRAAGSISYICCFDRWLMRQCRRFRLIEIALSEVIRDFVERALLPFLGLGQPENPALGIKRGTLAT